MVTDPGAAPSSGAVRSINTPEPVRVEVSAGGAPGMLAETRGRGKAVSRLTVESVEDTWRIADEWWREVPIVRTYFEVLLEDGRRTVLYRDDITHQWFKQLHG